MKVNGKQKGCFFFFTFFYSSNVLRVCVSCCVWCGGGLGLFGGEKFLGSFLLTQRGG